MIVLNKQQEEGLKVAIARFKNHERYTCISGYAGSGKSTLVKFIIEALPGIDPEVDVCYCAYTGKAAQVLLKKGNKNVSTLHHLMYKSIPLENGTWRRIILPITYKVLVIDEISMVPGSMLRQLMRNQVYILALGDPFQLPPVDKEDTNDILDHPHIFLSEIHRQAAESEIIKLSMDIREGKPLSLFNGNEVKIFDKKDFTEDMLLWPDQVLVATNKTRIELNNTIRRLLGREGGPQEGDKLICLRNYWDVYADTEEPLVNGTIGYLKNPYDSFVTFPYYLTKDKFKITRGDFESDGGSTFSQLAMDKHMILTGEKCCDWKTAFKIQKNEAHRYKLPLEFTYGNAITTWKAQGSEWDKVLIVEEGHPFDKVEHARFLYTSITRASEKAVIIRK